MSRRGIKVAVVAAVAAALSGVLGATAWAETVTPGVEQPIFDLKAPGGLLGGNSMPGTATNGNKSSAEGRDGKSYGAGSADPYLDSGSASDDTEDDGYWRTGSGEGSSDDE
jgi:hypothetical protein